MTTVRKRPPRPPHFAAARTYAVGSLIVAMMLAFVGPTAYGAGHPASHPAKAEKSGSISTLKWMIDQESWPTLDPAQATWRGTLQPVGALIYGQLFKLGSKNLYQPDLATGYKLSSDGMTFTMTLRPNVTFQDGTPFNAAAVKASLTRDLSPALHCTCLAILSPVKSITTPSDTTVQLQFSRPDGTILEALSGTTAAYVPSPTAVSKEGQTYGLNPVGAGPYRVVNNAVSSSLTLSTWSGYWDAKNVHVKTMQVLSGNSGPSEWATLQSGGVQVLSLPFGNPTVEKEAISAPGLKVTKAFAYSGLVYLNPGKPPFNNILARKAVEYATDAPAISTSLYYGLQPATAQLAGSGMVGYPGIVKGYPKYNLAKAKSMVKQLGGLSFTLNGGNTPSAIQESEALKKEWSQAGINVTINELSAVAGIAADEAGNYQAATGAYATQPAAVSALANVIGCPSLFDPAYCNPQVNALLAQAESTPNVKRQASFVRKAERIAMVTDATFIPVTEVPEITIAQKGVKGLVVAHTMVYASGVS